MAWYGRYYDVKRVFSTMYVVYEACVSGRASDESILGDKTEQKKSLVRRYSYSS